MDSMYSSSRARVFGFLALAAFESVFAGRVTAQDETSVKNVYHESTADRRVRIHYSLFAPSHLKFRVSAALLKKGDESFQYIPKNVSGDIGDTVAAGENKAIVWDILKEFPEGLEGEDFQFLVKAEAISPGTSPWYFIGGGAAVVGGVITYFLLHRDSGFPGPPTRPY